MGRDVSGWGYPADVDPSATALVRRRAWAPAGLSAPIAVAAFGLAALIAIVGVIVLDSDGGRDAISLSRLVAFDAAELRWQFGLIVVALAGLHYLASALAARAAAGIRLPLGELLLIQLAAAAANRLTPGGVGANALTARYLTRRGLRLPRALGAVSALVLFGAAADLLVLVGLVVFGRWFALPVGSGALAARLRRLQPPAVILRSGWLWAALAVALAAAVWLLGHRYRDRIIRFGRGVLNPIRDLTRHPRRLIALLLASGSTTLILGFAFAASTTMVPGRPPNVGLGVLVVAFMLGSAAAAAVPTPAGLGSTEAALVAVLVGVSVPAAHAVQVVVVFRVLTFWAPAVLGVLVTRRLHRLGAL